MSRRIKFLIEAVNQTKEPFQEVENGLERLRTTRREASRVVMEQARAEKYLRAVYKYQYQAYYDHLSVMRSVGSIGNQLITIVNQRNIAELRLGDALRDVADAQRLVNTYLDLYGDESVQYKKATEDLTEAQAKYKKAANDEAWGRLGVATSIVGMIGQVGLLILKFKELEMAYGTFTAIQATVTGAAAAIGGALTGIGGALTGLAMGSTMGAAATGLLTGGAMVAGMTIPDILAYESGQKVISPFSELLPTGAGEAYQQKGTTGVTPLDAFTAWRSEAMIKDSVQSAVEEKKITAAQTATKVTQTVNVNIQTVNNQANVEAVARAVQNALINKQRDVY